MNLQQKYFEQIQPELKQTLGLKNMLAVPSLKKIVINVGLGEALGDKKVIDKVKKQLAVITGQQPIVTRAKQSISTFKLRAGEAIGVKVTLRGKRMYVFLEKLIGTVLPRIRDFRGVKRTGFDGRGNYNLGVSEQSVFPELAYELIDRARGLEITLVTSARDDEAGLKLLKALGVPFEKS